MINEKLRSAGFRADEMALIKLAYHSALKRMPFADDSTKEALAEDLIDEFVFRAAAELEIDIAAAVAPVDRERGRAT